ncbi:cytochrome c biogenesis protein CCS1, chloroplastic-like [Primulina tabacum]|uniref:cytochrome c biogenesis protein CCS1, chloroplastic-like n=1 Tax=Primulina tabacum TaxID=48773 RepID=UPI003F5AB3DC
MFALAALMAVGTVIGQGEAPDFYFQKYSLSWDSLHRGGFSPSVLTICFHIRWSFVHSPEAVRKQDLELRFTIWGSFCAGYEVFLKGPSEG